MSNIPYGPVPVRTKCPFCNSEIVTKVKSKATRSTHLIALLICLFCCWHLAWIPYCKNSCQARNHYCPECKAYLGTYNNS